LPDKPRRRTFTADYKLAIVEAYDACVGDACVGDGDEGALLRREGLYSSHIAEELVAPTAMAWGKRSDTGARVPERLPLTETHLQMREVAILPDVWVHAKWVTPGHRPPSIEARLEFSMRLSLSRRRSALVAVVAAGATTVAVALPASALPHHDSTSVAVQAPALPGAQPITSRDRVYTADQTSNTVTVIDPATGKVLGTIPLGAQRLGGVLGPQYLQDVNVHGLGFSSDGRYLDVISVTTNTVTVIRTADNAIVSQTYVGRASHEGFFTPNGRDVWVADRALSRLDIVDAQHGGVVGHIPTGPGPSKVVFSPDGKRAYVNHIRSATVDVIDVASRRVIARIGGLADTFSSDEALSPDGQQLWVAHKKAGKVSVVDTRALKMTAVLDTGPGTNHPNFVTTAQGAFGYVTVGELNETKIYRRPGNGVPTLDGAIPSSGSEPHGIWPSPDNTRVFVVNERSDTVDVIDTARRQVIDTLHVGQEGQALVYVADAVPTGTGMQHLTRQGLGQQVVDAPALVDGPGKVLATVRAVSGLDMLELSGRGLNADTRYTAYGRLSDHSGEIPLLSFSTDAMGAQPQALAFMQFFGVYDPTTVTVQATGPGQATGQANAPPPAAD